MLTRHVPPASSFQPIHVVIGTKTSQSVRQAGGGTSGSFAAHKSRRGVTAPQMLPRKKFSQRNNAPLNTNALRAHSHFNECSIAFAKPFSIARCRYSSALPLSRTAGV